MISAAISTSLVAFFVLALVSPFLPLFLMWRCVTLSALAFLSYRLLRGPVHWSDQDWGYAIALAFLTLFTLSVAVALMVRLCIAAYYDRLRPEILAGKNTRWIDSVLLMATGAVGGLGLTTALALILGGSSGGRGLDLGIGLVASTVIVFMLVNRKGVLAIPTTALCVVVATLSFVGSQQARHIVEGAVAVADGRPWCIVVPKWRYARPSISDLGFYSLPKGSGLPNLVMFVRNGNTDTKAHWSIRQQRFVNGDVIAIEAACSPETNFADTLRGE